MGELLDLKGPDLMDLSFIDFPGMVVLVFFFNDGTYLCAGPVQNVEDDVVKLVE
jgi:hypothetical protein